MLHKRLTNPGLKDYSSFSDYFNICCILLFFLSAFVAVFPDDLFLMGARGYAFGLITGGSALDGYVPAQSFFGGAAIAMASFLIAYIPLTRMSHMFMKYFLYHRVKWDDAPSCRGGKVENLVKKNLPLKPTWHAHHIEADGHKTWRDIALTTPREMK